MRTLAVVLKVALTAGFNLSPLAQLYLDGVTVTIGKGDVFLLMISVLSALFLW